MCINKTIFSCSILRQNYTLICLFSKIERESTIFLGAINFRTNVPLDQKLPHRILEVTPGATPPLKDLYYVRFVISSTHSALISECVLKVSQSAWVTKNKSRLPTTFTLLLSDDNSLVPIIGLIFWFIYTGLCLTRRLRDRQVCPRFCGPGCMYIQ